MKKRFLTLICLTAALLLSGCEEGSIEQLKLISLSADTFAHNGGVGSADVNLTDITAVSSQPEWLKVRTFESTVLFNVYSNPTSEPRTADVTVSAGNAGEIVFTIRQSPFQGLYVTSESLRFSDSAAKQSIVVVSSGDFEVELTENPGGVFDYEIADNGMLNFYVTRPQGMSDYSGRAVISQTDGEESVIVSLYLPEKSVYDYLLGTWEVASNTSTSSYPMTFKIKESQASYYVYVDAPGMKAFPFVADFINGNVKISTGQVMGTDGTTYYNMHFNGPRGDDGKTYLWTSPGSVAWEAVPIFNEETGRISLTFTDNGQGKGAIARDLVFWCGKKYWDFASQVAAYTNLTLQKSYIE